MAGVTLKEIKKVYGKDVVAVDNFNLDIEDKEFIVFVGPSGCGKSTTLRMIAGLEDISGGELCIDGVYMNDVQPKERDIAMVFQNYALYPHMTVYDNMAFALKLRKVSKEEIREKVMEAAEILGITDYLQRKPKALSGGQRQRVAIGRAIVRHPKVFLMDEPLSNLDAKLRNQMRAELIKLKKRVNTTFIYVTHDQTEAMTLGDRIVVMKDGFIQQIGTPAEVFGEPNNLFVAGFIGSPQMNFFEGMQLVKENGTYSVKMHGNQYVLSDRQQKAFAQNDVAPQEVIVGVRPENMFLATENLPCMKASIEVMESMGSEMIVHSKIGEKTAVLKLTDGEMMDRIAKAFKAQEEVDFAVDVEKLHIFSKETENNLIKGDLEKKQVSKAG